MRHRHEDTGASEFWTDTCFYSGTACIALAVLMLWTHGPTGIVFFVGVALLAVAYRREPTVMLQPLDALRSFVHRCSQQIWPVTAGLIGVALLVSCAFYAGRSGPEQRLTASTEQNLMEGWAMLRGANASLPDATFAQADGYMALGELFAAQEGFSALHQGQAFYTILMDVQQAESNVLSHHATSRDWEVLAIFHRSLFPFRNAGFGDIPIPALDRALHAAAAQMGHGPG